MTPPPLRFVSIICATVAAMLPTLSRSAEAAYQVVPGWPALPDGKKLGTCAGVGIDSHDNVFVFHRNERSWSSPFPEDPLADPTIAVLDGKTGKIITEWGAGEFIMPHGLTIDREDNVWLTDVARQQVFKYTHEGKLLMTLGERCRAGADEKHFNLPTDIAVLADGSFYVSDGYRNTRVVKFDATGKYQFEWGGKGSEPGRFNLPHGIAVDGQGRVLVCDRSNARLQIFDPMGKFITQAKGENIGRPFGVAVGANDHIFLIDGGEQREPDHGKVVELNPTGAVVATFGSHGPGRGQFETGHDIAVAHDGAIYVAEGKGKRVQKFIRTLP